MTTSASSRSSRMPDSSPTTRYVAIRSAPDAHHQMPSTAATPSSASVDAATSHHHADVPRDCPSPGSAPAGVAGAAAGASSVMLTARTVAMVGLPAPPMGGMPYIGAPDGSASCSPSPPHRTHGRVHCTHEASAPDCSNSLPAG